VRSIVGRNYDGEKGHRAFLNNRGVMRISFLKSVKENMINRRMGNRFTTLMDKTSFMLG
jgi:hypothetical protein